MGTRLVIHAHMKPMEGRFCLIFSSHYFYIKVGIYMLPENNSVHMHRGHQTVPPWDRDYTSTASFTLCDTCCEW